jgi:hypothetical protein
VLFAVIPVFVGCGSASCSKFEATQNIFSAQGMNASPNDRFDDDLDANGVDSTSSDKSKGPTV